MAEKSNMIEQGAFIEVGQSWFYFSIVAEPWSKRVTHDELQRLVPENIQLKRDPFKDSNGTEISRNELDSSKLVFIHAEVLNQHGVFVDSLEVTMALIALKRSDKVEEANSSNGKKVVIDDFYSIRVELNRKKEGILWGKVLPKEKAGKKILT